MFAARKADKSSAISKKNSNIYSVSCFCQKKSVKRLKLKVHVNLVVRGNTFFHK